MSKPDIHDIAHNLLSKLNNYEVNSNGCWIHQYATTTNGYVRLRYYKSYKEYSYPAHNISYVIHKGPIPDGLEVCHVCDVRNCVNPQHLFVDTRKGNLQDMRKKRRGSSRGHAQITEDEENFILMFREKGYSQEKIGKILGLTQASVSNVLRRR